MRFEPDLVLQLRELNRDLPLNILCAVFRLAVRTGGALGLA